MLFSDMHLQKRIFSFQNLSYFRNAFSKTAFRKCISEILRVLQIKQNNPLSHLFYPKSSSNFLSSNFLQKQVCSLQLSIPKATQSQPKATQSLQLVSFSIFRSMIQISFRVFRNCKNYIGVG